MCERCSANAVQMHKCTAAHETARNATRAARRGLAGGGSGSSCSRVSEQRARRRCAQDRGTATAQFQRPQAGGPGRRYSSSVTAPFAPVAAAGPVLVAAENRRGVCGDSGAGRGGIAREVRAADGQRSAGCEEEERAAVGVL